MTVGEGTFLTNLPTVIHLLRNTPAAKFVTSIFLTCNLILSSGTCFTTSHHLLRSQTKFHQNEAGFIILANFAHNTNNILSNEQVQIFCIIAVRKVGIIQEFKPSLFRDARNQASRFNHIRESRIRPGMTFEVEFDVEMVGWRFGKFGCEGRDKLVDTFFREVRIFFWYDDTVLRVFAKVDFNTLAETGIEFLAVDI